MADVGDLAALSNWAYDPNTKDLQAIGNGAWVERASTGSAGASFGFYGYTVYNTVTNDVVIVYRGTDPSNPANLVEDALLSTKLNQILNPIARLATQYAQTQALLYSNSTVTLTGHSLGGYGAEVAMIALEQDQNSTSAFRNSLSGVAFNAPGVTLSDPVANAQSYNFYNFNAQGDIVHRAGGAQLGQSVTLAVGPTPAQETSDFLNGWNLSKYGVRTGIIAGSTNLIHDWLAAHTINNFWGVNAAFGNTPGYFNTNSSQGLESAAHWFQFHAGSGVSGNGGLTLNGNTASLSDSAGDTMQSTADLIATLVGDRELRGRAAIFARDHAEPGTQRAMSAVLRRLSSNREVRQSARVDDKSPVERMVAG